MKINLNKKVINAITYTGNDKQYEPLKGSRKKIHNRLARIVCCEADYPTPQMRGLESGHAYLKWNEHGIRTMSIKYNPHFKWIIIISFYNNINWHGYLIDLPEWLVKKMMVATCHLDKK